MTEPPPSRSLATEARPPADTAPDLTGITVFRAGVRIRDRITVPVHGRPYPVSPVSAGFVVLRADRLATDHRLAADALRLGRPVVLVGPATGPAAALARATDSHWSSTAPPEEVHFLTPRGFVADRAAAIRRRQAERPEADLPPQRVAALGVGPRPYGTTAALRTALDRARAVVGTDWTFDTTLPAAGLRLPTGVSRHVVPYDITDYDRTIRGFDTALTALQRAGVDEVALLIEGNPDTLDVLDGVGLTHRTLDLVPGVPVAVAAAGEVTARLRPQPFGSGLAYLSGLPGRHGQSQRQLLAELSRYLAGGLSCVLVEMTLSDLASAVEAVRRAPVPKTVVVLADYSSPSARIRVAHARSPEDVRAVIARGRGVLSTVLVFDDPAGDLARALR
ncbi:hypothetical protein [Micromonospora auratinigra]|uniref:Uncharacterized protein n=1 Tax=Micromonospora auratinigra TaxID=261654 RepID=A0A1A8ZGS5_9ACTN|nr:hypothetical protein [Micromonospora auratinigra]SBT43077.1 hypothetical protein GA0070611_2189 [Micromonospora auratinigra]